MQMISKNKLSKIFKDVNRFEVEDKVCVLIDNLKDKFNTGFDVRPGNKYIKIINSGSVWGFICLYDDHKFNRGDILKPAGFNAPARNFARGNVFKLESYNAVWSGA